MRDVTFAGATARPDLPEFAREILRRDVAKYLATPLVARWVFFDRGVVDALGLVQEVSPWSLGELQETLARYRFHRRVFILPPWESIYTNDAERDQPFAEAVDIHTRVVRWYQSCGYALCAMTRDPTQRAQFVRESCADEPDVRNQVESMLAEIDRSQLIDRPALESVADLLASETLIGAQIGPYRIESLLGVGGMGEVYRATDTVLGRQVAVKMLPPVLAGDPERLARFHREARLLASLNHPHIAAIYGTERLPGEASAGLALILELAEGVTLAQKLEAGRLPIDEVMAIARQVAEALEAAHRQGIIHRDLKPSNIAIAPDGTVKVLDFGLAKLTQREGEVTEADATTSPTITAPGLVTGAGVLLGTAAYMSPEQAKAREADNRSDIWAFGCVLFEMLTGRRAFDGADPVEVLGAVVRLEPDWRAMPPDVPIPLRTLVERCLVKDRRHRLGDISTARFVFDHMATFSRSTAISSGASKPTLRYLVAALAVALLMSAVAAAGGWWLRRPLPPVVAKFSFSPTGAAAINVDVVSIDLAILPDGRHFVYIARGGLGSGPRLLVRSLDQLEPRPIVTVGVPRAPFA